MAHRPNRRRFLALAGLVFGAGVAPPLRAQVASSAPPMVDGKPVDPNLPVMQDIGSWHIVSQINLSRAWPRDGVGVRSGGIREGDRLTGGNGELNLEYFSGNSKYRGSLSIGSVGIALGGFKTRVLADDRELDRFVTDGGVKRDLTTWFGSDLAGLANVKALRALMEVNGTEYTVFELALDKTPEALAAMRVVPDYNYNVRGIGRSSPSRSSQSSQPGGCYLTTACCDLVGLDDDCFELRTLRGFRDRVMASTARGRRDVASYYETAPMILAEMERRGETHRLARFYFTHILPSAVLARLGFERLPFALYGNMARRLVARYLPERAGLLG